MYNNSDLSNGVIWFHGLLEWYIQSQVGFWVLVINLRGGYNIVNCVKELVKLNSIQDFVGQEKLAPLVKSPEGTLKEEKC